MKESVLEIIERLTKKKEQANIFPVHVLDVEIKEEFRKQYNAAILELKDEKKIKLGKSINNNFIELNQ